MADDSPGQAVLREILEVHRQGVETTRALSDRQHETPQQVLRVGAELGVIKERLADIGALKDACGRMEALQASVKETLGRVEAAQASNRGLSVIEERLADLGPLLTSVAKIETQLGVEREPVEKTPLAMWAIIIFLLVSVVTLAGVQITGNAAREPGTIPAGMVPKLPGVGP